MRDAPNAYSFAEPVASQIGLKALDVDLLRNQMRELESELSRQDEKAQTVISRFRSEATAAKRQGGKLPTLPPELHELQSGRYELINRHIKLINDALGSESTARLEQYLYGTFAAHVSVKPMGEARKPIQGNRPAAFAGNGPK